MIHYFEQEKQIETLKGHQASVNFLIVKNDILFSASEDKSIKVWSLHDFECRATVEEHTSSINTLFFYDDEFLIAGGTDKIISVISLLSYDHVGKTQLSQQIQSIVPILNNKYWVAAEGKDLYFMENPFKSSILSVFSQSPQMYKYMTYIKHLTMGLNPEYDEQFDNSLILPFKINCLHVYSYYSLPHHLKQALKNETPLIISQTGHSPLSLAIAKNLISSIDLILRHLVKQVENDDTCLRILQNDLVELNSEDSEQLLQLYNVLFIKNQADRTPKFVVDSSKLPVIVSSDTFAIQKEQFMEEDNYNIEGEAVQFFSSGMKIQTEMGSSGSLALLNSILNSPVTNIHKTKFVKTLLEHKWAHLKWFMYFQGLLYIIYLINLTLFSTINIQENSVFLYIAFVINIFLLLYEIFQMFVTKGQYWTDIMNYVDIVRGLSLIFVTVQNILQQSWVPQILVLLTTLSWLRGINYFRLFAKTRYMVNLISEVCKDMVGFLIILAYSTYAFSMIYLVIQENIQLRDVPQQFILSYRLDLGDFQFDDYGTIAWICFFIATLINQIIMLNLLISIMGDTYGRVQEEQDVADGIQLTNLVIECEQFLFWKRNQGKTAYYQICQKVERKASDNSALGRMRDLKATVLNFQRKFVEAREEEDERYEQLREMIEKRFDEIVELVRKERKEEGIQLIE